MSFELFYAKLGLFVLVQQGGVICVLYQYDSCYAGYIIHVEVEK